MSELGRGSLPASYFEAIYAEADDPWSFASSPYEGAKYANTLATLPRPTYRSAFEIGCSIGVLTQQLARRCRTLLSVDVSEAALEQARRRCLDQPWVAFKRMAVPDMFPTGQFDLIVVSEVGYYWAMADFERTARLCADHLEIGGQLLLVHWTPYVSDYPLTGDEVHNRLLALSQAGDLPLVHLNGFREEQYRLDLLERTR